MVRISSPLLLAAFTVLAVQGSHYEDTCTTKSQRRAWHTLTDYEKSSYIEAELCLMQKEATLGLEGPKNRFEELQATHQIQAGITHEVGAFLPFHRLLMHAHEKLLQEECGYDGTQPYWDEPREAGYFSSSDIFNPKTGFGGDGVGEEGCIDDGPFAGYVNSLGPGYRLTDHCITRFISDEASLGSLQESVDACHEAETFIDAWICIEAAPHRGGHGGVGGLMLDSIASPGDPLFYLHHTWLDKVFWDWQALDLPARLTEIGGPNVQQESYEGSPKHSHHSSGRDSDYTPPEEGYGRMRRDFRTQRNEVVRMEVPEGDPGSETTLDHVLNMFGVYRNATIGEVMDIGGGLLCYEYV